MSAVPALRPDPDQARDWVRAELTKPEYQPSLIERIVDWFRDLLGDILGTAREFGGLDPAVAVALLVGVVVVVAIALARLRREPSDTKRRTPGAVLTEERKSAAEHRALALRALAEERWDEAVVESVRAIAVGLAERDLVDDQPGVTAREVADAGARRFGAFADRLHAAADVFDGVLYGDHRARHQDATELVELEAGLRHARPSAEAAGGPVLAVPR